MIAIEKTNHRNTELVPSKTEILSPSVVLEVFLEALNPGYHSVQLVDLDSSDYSYIHSS